MRSRHRASWGTVMIFCVASVFAAVFGLRLFRLLSSLSTAGYDLTKLGQAMWNSAHRKNLASTNAYPVAHRSGLLNQPALLYSAPLCWIFPPPEMPLWTKMVVVTIGAAPVRWLARPPLHHKLRHPLRPGRLVPLCAAIGHPGCSEMHPSRARLISDIEFLELNLVPNREDEIVIPKALAR